MEDKTPRDHHLDPIVEPVENIQRNVRAIAFGILAAVLLVGVFSYALIQVRDDQDQKLERALKDSCERGNDLRYNQQKLRMWVDENAERIIKVGLTPPPTELYATPQFNCQRDIP